VSKPAEIAAAERLREIEAQVDWATVQDGVGGYGPELNAIAEKAIEGGLDDVSFDDPGADLIVCAADVEPRDTDWLWDCRLPCGQVTILFGEPGKGKTHVGLDIVTRVSRAAAWPDGGRARLGSSVIVSGEDDWATTLRPRLDYAEADLSHVFFFPAIATFGEGDRRTFRLATDGPTLERNLRRANAVSLMVDPLTCFLDGVDTHRTSDVRIALSILADVAARTGVAVFCVLHPNKNDHAQVTALNRIAGSGAFGAAARSVMAVTPDPEDESGRRRLLLPVKNNNCLDPDGLGFRITSDDPKTCRSRVTWDFDPVDTDADAAFGLVRSGGRETVKAQAFLRRVLGDGEPYPSVTLLEEGEAAGFSEKTLKRAKKNLRVESHRLGGLGAGGAWYWQLVGRNGDL